MKMQKLATAMAAIAAFALASPAAHAAWALNMTQGVTDDLAAHLRAAHD